jgi:nucleoside-diphosphate-sugar epimerase
VTSEAILVTGASGAMGQQLLALLAESFPVVGVTRQTQLEELPASPRIAYRGWEILDQPAHGKYRSVVHLAAAVDFSTEPESVRNCIRGNVCTTARVVDFCVKSRVQKLVYTSTVSVYADDGGGPKSETARIGPASPYAACKWMSELLVAGARQRGISPVILRLAGIYGHRDRTHPVLNRWIGQALRGERLIVEKPKLARDYIYLKDAAAAVAKAAVSPAAGTFNIATGNALPLGAMAETAQRILGGSIEIRDASHSSPASDLRYDVSRARSELGFQCRYDLASALEELRAVLAAQ